MFARLQLCLSMMKESPNATRMSASHASHAQELALFPLFPRNKKHNEEPVARPVFLLRFSAIIYAMNENKEKYILPEMRREANRARRNTAAECTRFVMSEEAEELGRGKKYYIRTYGCQANVRDGETMAGMLEMMGFAMTESVEEADVLIFNTCAIRQAAEDRVFGEIGSLKSVKARHPGQIICLCGCMAQEEVVIEKILKSYPQVDLVFGTHNLWRLPQLLADVMTKGERMIEVESEEGDLIEDMPVRRSASCKGFVHIMYGCDKFCTYCIVPYTRGRERSRRPQDILEEVKALKQQGMKEAVLLGQNVNAYGKDLKIEDGFTKLLESCAETGIERIRFYTSHPRDYSSTTIDAMVKYPNIMKSLHLPVQSGSDEILKRMNRGYTADHFRQLYDEMRAKISDITFTTDLIVGFPSETDEQFQATLDLVDYCQFDMAYSFVYSPRSGTPAAKMADDIPLQVKKERLQILNDRLSAIASKRNEAYVGKTLKVLCEGPSKKNQNVYSGYSEENKLVNFTGPAGLKDQIVDVKIDTAHSFSLDGSAL